MEYQLQPKLSVYAEPTFVRSIRPIAEIGFASGYDSLPFFHKQFNKFKGITPSGYRKKYDKSGER